VADLNQAIDFVINLEDAGLTGRVTCLRGDPGGRTRFGLAERWHPELTATGYFDTMSNVQAIAVAQNVYAAQYAKNLAIPEITSQDVANRVLSFAVNEGQHEAVLLLQRALVACGQAVAEDGVPGPATLAAENACPPQGLVAQIRAVQKQFYIDLVAAKPSLQPELNGLINRAEA
jgi:lysozyme family protein